MYIQRLKHVHIKENFILFVTMVRYFAMCARASVNEKTMMYGHLENQM